MSLNEIVNAPPLGAITVGMTQRALRIARWLAQNAPAPVVTELALLYQSSDAWDLVGRYTRDDVMASSAHVAQAIDETVRGIANETRTRIAARIVWYTSDGKEWVSLPLHIPPDNPEDERPNLDGSALSLVKQAQTHTEVSIRQNASILQEMIATLREVVRDAREENRQLRGMLAEANRQVEEAHDEVAEAEARAAEAIETAEEVTEAAEEAVEAADEDKQNKLLRLVAQAASASGLKIPGQA
jgi:hypothetical protein